jgi:CRISPR-associated protein (TIGR02710 family)
MSQACLLVCTVGGSPEPIVASLKKWQPQRVWFVVTPQTREQVARQVVPLAAAEGMALDAGRYEFLELPDGQDFARCVDKLRQLTPEVERWLGRGEDCTIVADFTGGTKCMSAALALHAHRWPCQFSYVGGQERTKDGVGVVVSGKEQIQHTQNPWDALGYQAIEDAMMLFDQGAYAACSQLLNKSVRNVRAQARRREFMGLKTLADAYDAWDKFDHKQAQSNLRDLEKYENDLVVLLGTDRAERLREEVQRQRAYLAELVGADGPTGARIKDLLANAARRAAEGRLDDAVARLYRSIEATAQARLNDKYGIAETKKVPLEKVPEPLKSEWQSRVREGAVFLGLQEDYALLLALGDDLGRIFQELGLNDREKSPLVSRNQSILAHGFAQVGDSTFQQLWAAALKLSGLHEKQLATFSRLA